MASDDLIVKELVASLSNDTTTRDAIPASLCTSLQRLKELTRAKSNAAALYTERGMDMLLDYGFGKWSRQEPDASAEAKRCLANALTLEDRCVDLFCDENGFQYYIRFSQNQKGILSFEDEFLCARILFLVTGKRGASIKDVMPADSKHLTALIASWLQRHRNWTQEETSISNATIVTALCETLKLCFNIAMFLPELCAEVLKQGNSARWVLDMINDTTHLQDAQVRLVVPHLINLLVALEKDLDHIDTERYVVLFDILDEYVEASVQAQMWHNISITDGHLIPLITALSNLQSSHASVSGVQAMLQQRLLVPATERSLPLGKSASKQARILQLLNKGSPALQESLATLLYQVSESSPAKFIANVGYGHAIGFLTAHGIAISPADIPVEHAGQSIDPVTGQNMVDRDAQDAQRQLKEMTDEEKEQEAEKLFVLFQRLKKNGIIDVKDPIQQAVDEGRFEEM